MSKWPPRTDEEHIELAKDIQSQTTKTSKEAKESEYGVRYSTLFELPYWKPVTMHCIDGLHNLYLGSSKGTFEVMIDTGVLDYQKLKEIDSRMTRLKLPTDIGRIPHSMSSGYKRMKGDEWKTWLLVYSLYCLKGIIPNTYYNMWTTFVLACKLITKRQIQVNDLERAHDLFVLYANKYVELFGKEKCTFNIHLHLHIKECILNFGPIYAYWCFSFERFNGILGSYHTNIHDISLLVSNKRSTICYVS